MSKDLAAKKKQSPTMTPEELVRHERQGGSLPTLLKRHVAKYEEVFSAGAFLGLPRGRGRKITDRALFSTVTQQQRSYWRCPAAVPVATLEQHKYEGH
jgi:hypothetical protein